ncbi:MAG: nitrogen fixation protein NifE [Clostridiales Family XIII bacterium]|nr:nitrogen fixation protein NifE [Clostridiales Family XIII bacterium]
MAKPIITKNREDYPNTFYGGGGGCGESLVRFKCGCFKNAERSFEQTKQCVQMSSVQVLTKIDDALCVFHSPIGCTGCTSFINGFSKLKRVQAGKGAPRNIPYIVTNMDERDIVFGGTDKLIEAVAEGYRRYKPKVVFVLASCASGIIGDNINAAARKAEEQIGARVIPIHCEGFKSQLNATGIDAAFDAIIGYLLDGTKPEKEDDLINLFFPQSLTAYDRLEMSRLVELFGKRANTVPDYAAIDDILRIPAASATISACYIFADHLAEWLEAEYGIPYDVIGLPIGIQNTDRYLRALGKLFGQEDVAEAFIEKEHKRIEKPLGELRAKLAGKRVLTGSGTSRSLATALLAGDLGMELVAIQTPVLNGRVAAEIEVLADRHGAGFVLDLSCVQPFELANIIKKHNVEFLIGFNTVATFLGVPGIQTQGSDDFQQMGYDGVLNLGEKIVRLSANPTFQAHLRDRGYSPYREDWYEKEPFSYLKEGAI